MDDGTEAVPRTVKSTNQDPIPNMDPKGNIDANYQMSNYIRLRDECLDGLSENLIKHWRCVKYYSGGSVDGKIPEQDIVGKALLDQESPTAMHNLVYSMMNDENVRGIIRTATKTDECSAQHILLAYFIGQLCGIELSESSLSLDEIDPQGLLKNIGT